MVEYTERFKKENSIMKFSIGETKWGSFFQTTEEFKKLDEVNDE